MKYIENELAIDEYRILYSSTSTSVRQEVSLNELTDSEFVLPKLVPFVLSVHAEAWCTVALQNPGYADYIPFRLATPDDIQVYYLEQIQTNPQSTLFAIIDKTRAASDGRVSDMAIADIIGVLACIPQDLKVEIGPVLEFPTFRGTHVSEHAMGALLKDWLDVPLQGGMGFRRVAWTTNVDKRHGERTSWQGAAYYFAVVVLGRLGEWS